MGALRFIDFDLPVVWTHLNFIQMTWDAIVGCLIVESIAVSPAKVAAVIQRVLGKTAVYIDYWTCGTSEYIVLQLISSSLQISFQSFTSSIRLVSCDCIKPSCQYLSKI